MREERRCADDAGSNPARQHLILQTIWAGKYGFSRLYARSRVSEVPLCGVLTKYRLADTNGTLAPALLFYDIPNSKREGKDAG